MADLLASVQQLLSQMVIAPVLNEECFQGPQTCSQLLRQMEAFGSFWIWKLSTCSCRFKSSACNQPGQSLPPSFQDAYFNIPIFPPHQRCLHFTVGYEHYYIVPLLACPLNFYQGSCPGPSSAVFRGHIVSYQGDFPLKDQSPLTLSANVQQRVQNLERFCWILSLRKSSLEPTCLGLRLEMALSRIFLPWNKLQSARSYALVCPNFISAWGLWGWWCFLQGSAVQLVSLQSQHCLAPPPTCSYWEELPPCRYCS